MKKMLTVIVAMCFIVSAVMVAVAAEKYSVKGPVLSVDPAGKTVTVKATEQVSEKATNRWKGDVTFVTDNMTKVMMGKKSKNFDALKAGQEVKVVFHEKGDTVVAEKIIIIPPKKGM
ncbi:MAG: hypothetical protein ACLPX5_00850 [Dissulfurispiraceae bacterium]